MPKNQQMKKITIAIATLFSIISLNSAMAQQNHLIPEVGIFNTTNSHLEYCSKVRKVLFQGLEFRPLARLLILPSFTPENVVEIEFDRANNKMYVVYQIAEKMIWNNDNWEQIKLTKIKKEIAKESAQLIIKLFQTAVGETKQSDDERITIVGENYQLTVQHASVDGENYIFTANIPIPKIGTTLSPPAESKMGRLVSVGLQLITLAKSDKESIEFDTKFKAQIAQLIVDLKTVI